MSLRLCLALLLPAALVRSAPVEQWLVVSVSAPGKAWVHYNEGEPKVLLNPQRIVLPGAILTFADGASAVLQEIGKKEDKRVPVGDPERYEVPGRRDITFAKSLREGFVNASTKRALGNNRLLSPPAGGVLLPVSPLTLRWTPSPTGERVRLKIERPGQIIWEATIAGGSGTATVAELPERLLAAAPDGQALKVECSAYLENDAPAGAKNVCTIPSAESRQRLAAQLAESDTVANLPDRQALRAVTYYQFNLPEQALAELEAALETPRLAAIADYHALAALLAELTGRFDRAKQRRAQFDLLVSR